MEFWIKSLEWSEVRGPNDDIRYHHVISETPFGRFLITWKGWKEDDSPTIDETPWGGWYPAAMDLEGAKKMCEEEFIGRVNNLIEVSA